MSGTRCYSLAMANDDSLFPYPHEISVDFGDCSGIMFSSLNSPQTCCASNNVTTTVTCRDSYGDGWHGSYLTIDSVPFCTDFYRGYTKEDCALTPYTMHISRCEDDSSDDASSLVSSIISTFFILVFIFLVISCCVRRRMIRQRIMRDRARRQQRRSYCATEEQRLPTARAVEIPTASVSSGVVGVVVPPSAMATRPSHVPMATVAAVNVQDHSTHGGAPIPVASVVVLGVDEEDPNAGR